MKFDSIPFPQVGFREIPNLHGAREQLRSKRKKGDHVHSRAVRARMAHSSLWDRLPEEIQHRIQTTAEELRLKFAPSWFDVSSTDGPMLRDIIKEHMKATHVTTPKPGLHRLRRSKLLAIVKKHGVTKEAFNVKRPFWVESDHRAFSRFAALKVGDTIPFQCWHSRYPNTAIHAKAPHRYPPHRRCRQPRSLCVAGAMPWSHCRCCPPRSRGAGARGTRSRALGRRRSP